MNETFETMGDWLERYNPFAMKDAKKKVLYFPTYCEAYLYAMKRIRKRSPRGYFDMVLFLMDEVIGDKDTAEELTKDMGRLYLLLRGQCIMLDWEDKRETENDIATILKGLHTITETEFDYGMFEMAWLKFKEWEARYEDVNNAD